MSRSNRPGGRGPSTQPCRDWREGVPNSCRFADRCNFAHSGGGRPPPFNDPPAKGGGFGTFGSNNAFGSGGFGSTANSFNTSFGGGNNTSFGSSGRNKDICKVRIGKKPRFQ